MEPARKWIRVVSEEALLAGMPWAEAGVWRRYVASEEHLQPRTRHYAPRSRA